MYFDELTTQIITIGDITTERPTAKPSGVLRLRSDGIGGLSNHIGAINEDLSFLTNSLPHLHNRHLLGPTAFLLHGPEGTGKSLLLDRLAECPWAEVYRINPDTNPKGQAKAVSDIFEEARENQPSLILMDNLDRLLEKADTLVNRLRTELATLEGSQVVVAAAARSVYDVDSSLRTAAAFQTELELLPPNTKQREEIVRQVLGPTCNVKGVDFTALAERSHGFVGRDIASLCRLARKRHTRRIDQLIDEKEKAELSKMDEQTDFIEQEDFDAVIEQVRPTVLKDSILEVPKVRWTDIAGLDHVRAVLEAITIRPFKVSVQQFPHLCFTNKFMAHIPKLFTSGSRQRLTASLVPGSRRQIWRAPIAQGRSPLRPTRLRKDIDCPSGSDRKQAELPCCKGFRADQDVCWRV